MRTKDEVLTWDEMGFTFAWAAAARSKDPQCQNGACLMKDNKSIGVGYVGFVRGIEDTEERWTRENKYDFGYHAEANAIANADSQKIEGSTLYLWSSDGYLPCESCVRSIVQYGISEVKVAYIKDTDYEKYNWKKSMWLLNECGVKLTIVDSIDNNVILGKLRGMIE
jgi:dCMP deaminase